MYRRAMVVSLKGGDIRVLPLFNDECASCAAGCSKRGEPFAVTNPNKLPLKTGVIVSISSPKQIQAVEGLLSLLVPFTCSVAAYFAAVPLAGCFGLQAGDGLRAVSVLVGLALSSLGVLIITRKLPFRKKPEIREILHQADA